jgi:hypothetical protein
MLTCTGVDSLEHVSRLQHAGHILQFHTLAGDACASNSAFGRRGLPLA